MANNSCLAKITAGVAVGGAVGGAVALNAQKEVIAHVCLNYIRGSAVYGTYEAIKHKIPGLLKVRHIGQTTVSSAAIFGLFLGAGSLIHCGKSY